MEIFFTTKINATEIHLKVRQTLCMCLLSFFHWTTRNQPQEKSEGESLRTSREGNVSVMETSYSWVSAAFCSHWGRQVRWQFPSASLSDSSVLTWWITGPFSKIKRNFHSTDGKNAERLLHCKAFFFFLKSHRGKEWFIHVGCMSAAWFLTPGLSCVANLSKQQKRKGYAWSIESPRTGSWPPFG